MCVYDVGMGTLGDDQREMSRTPSTTTRWPYSPRLPALTAPQLRPLLRASISRTGLSRLLSKQSWSPDRIAMLTRGKPSVDRLTRGQEIQLYLAKKPKSPTSKEPTNQMTVPSIFISESISYPATSILTEIPRKTRNSPEAIAT